MLEEVKNNLRIYDNEDDVEISGLIEAAESYIVGCVGETFKNYEQALPIFKTLVKKVVADLYENRGMNVDGNIKRDGIVTTMLEKLASYGDEYV